MISQELNFQPGKNSGVEMERDIFVIVLINKKTFFFLLYLVTHSRENYTTLHIHGTVSRIKELINKYQDKACPIYLSLCCGT